MINNLTVLTAQKGNRERRRITLKEVSKDTGTCYHTLILMSKQQLKEYPIDVMQRLCNFFKCEIQDLLTLVDEEE